MNATLHHAFEVASTLSQDEQEAMGRIVLEEIEAERRWVQTLACTQGKLSGLAAKARQEIASGQTFDIDPADTTVTVPQTR